MSSPSLARRSATVLAAVLLGLLAAWSAALPASAHAALRTSNPVDRAVLPTAPTSLTLGFSESVSLQRNAIRLFDAVGQPVVVTATATDDTVNVAVPERLAKGSYVLSYRVTSADGHPISGALEFSVQAASTVNFTPADPQASGPLTSALRAVNGLGYAGLLIAVGGAVFLTLIMPRGASTMAGVRRRLVRVVIAAAAVTLAATVVGLPVLSLWQGAGSLGELARGETWTAALQGASPFAVLAPPALVLAGLAAVVYALRLAGPDGAARPGLVVAGGAVALSSLVINGHTRAYGPSWVSYPIDLLHVAAAAVWLGSLVGLAVASWRSSGASASDVAATVSRFSGFALETIVVLSAAGVVMSWLILDSLGDLFRTSWGVTLLVKVSLVGVVLAVAGLNRWRLLPYVQRQSDEQRAWRWLRRTLRIEAALLLAVVGVTGVLVTQSPVRAVPTAAAAPQPQTLTTEVPLSSGSMTFTLEPVRRGKNTVTITVVDDGGQPVELSEPPVVKSTFASLGLGPFESAMVDIRPGTYSTTVLTNYPGQWLLTIPLRLDKYRQASPEFPVDIP